ncbi:MAG TPA: FCD domain-containing protein [Anaerolineales bacterium]|jgi:DNA-binding FadR family transcriptional regulator
MSILRERSGSDTLSEFMRYLANHEQAASQTLPALTELSRELGVSVASLREQLEVARALGLVDVRPRTGTRRLPYTFGPAVRQSLRYALALEDGHFEKFAELRKHIETAYWHEAVTRLTADDKGELRALIARAHEKLNGTPIQAPHEEHRNLHLLIYRRLENPFVTGLLEAYWDAYEAVGLNMFRGGYDYLQEVWRYHAEMVEAIDAGNYEAGYDALVKHTDLLYQRPD